MALCWLLLIWLESMYFLEFHSFLLHCLMLQCNQHILNSLCSCKSLRWTLKILIIESAQRRECVRKRERAKNAPYLYTSLFVWCYTVIHLKLIIRDAQVECRFSHLYAVMCVLLTFIVNCVSVCVCVCVWIEYCGNCCTKCSHHRPHIFRFVDIHDIYTI